MTEELELIRGSENPFRDVGLPDADTKLIKADLAAEIIGVWRSAGIQGRPRRRLPAFRRRIFRASAMRTFPVLQLTGLSKSSTALTVRLRFASRYGVLLLTTRPLSSLQQSENMELKKKRGRSHMGMTLICHRPLLRILRPMLLQGYLLDSIHIHCNGK
jgi:hypothetical protein